MEAFTPWANLALIAIHILAMSDACNFDQVALTMKLVDDPVIADADAVGKITADQFFAPYRQRIFGEGSDGFYNAGYLLPRDAAQVFFR